ncbi:MAG: hypothetical protein ABFD97_25640 [Syntrophobacter sp.]
MPVQLGKTCCPFGLTLELGYIVKEKLEDEWPGLFSATEQLKDANTLNVVLFCGSFAIAYPDS